MARVRVCADRSTKWVAARITPTPMPIPRMAVTSGRPAATSEPNVTTSTTAATIRPMPSEAPFSAWFCIASPPTSTVSPAARAWATAVSSAARAGLVSSTAGTR